jgi:dTDP-4-amino-4,6-dideoxygalactose transaminase
MQWLRPEKRLPVARELGETSLVFPVDPTLDNDQMQYTADILIRVMQKAVR